MESFAESAERSELELRNSDYDYSRFAIADADDLVTCLSGLSSVASCSEYSLPPSEVAVELNSAYSHLTEGVYSQYSLAAPSEAEVEVAEGLTFPLTTAASNQVKAFSLDDLLQTAVSEVETGKFVEVLESLDNFLEAQERDALDEVLQTAVSEADTAVEMDSIYSVYSIPASEADVEINEALYAQHFPGSAAELANDLMALAPEAEGFAPVAIDSLVVDFGAPLVKVASLEDLLQTAVSEVETAVRRDSLHSMLQTGVSEVATAINRDALHSVLQTAVSEVETAVRRDSLHSMLQTGVSEVATAINRDALHSVLQTAVSEVATAVSNWDAQSWEADLETCLDSLSIHSEYSEYSLPASEVEVEMTDNLTFPLTTEFETEQNSSFYALEELNPANAAGPLQFRRSSQYAVDGMQEFQAWHEDNKVDDSVTVDVNSEQFVRLGSNGSKKMFASTASEYCIDKVE